MQKKNKIHITIAFGYKQSEHGNILCEMLRQLKELENITYRYCKNVGMISSTVHCQLIQNDYPEWCSNACTSQNGLYSKRCGYSYLFNKKSPSCKNCLKKRLSKVISHFKNAVICKGACRVCGDWWTDLSNKNYWFPKHKDYPTVKGRREKNGNEENINIHIAPDERPIYEENLLSPCKITFKVLNQALRYAQYYFQNKLWNKNKMLDYLRTC